ncbi:MAG: von Willebrand factor type A domain-containing protein [Chitinophagales bacterium]
MKNAIIYILFVFLQICLFTNLYAQTGEIQGKVTNVETGETIPFVNVSIDISGNLGGTTTDFDGIYSLTSVRPGLYTVTFSYVGYHTKQIEKVQVNANKTTFLNAQLSISGELLDIVEVVEYKVPLLRSDQTSTGQTVTSEQIQSMPTRNVNPIAGSAAGVYQADRSSNVNVKGARNQATEYHIDGIKVRDSNQFPNTAIEQTPVIIGGIPAKYENAEDYHNQTKEERFMRNPQIEKPEEIEAQQSYNANPYPYKNVVVENPFLHIQNAPLSTFSIDVDKAAYSYLRSTLNANALPYPHDVRIEEMINYFDYEYPQPQTEVPFSITTELTDCPWNPNHQLALIGLQGREIEMQQVPPQNLVFLMDVSGSMSSENKLPLLKSAFRLLVGQLRPQDKVAIVVYAGAAGVVLNPTNGDQKTTILDALGKLEAGGSTAGGAGIELAYDLAYQNFESGGNNRVILATDGDFNVGTSSDDELVRLIEEKRKTGIFLTVLGFGMGNYQDSKMEKLSNHGNGNYAYIDNFKEARKTLINELSGTLFTIAKDVKLQVEFNPKEVQGYRLIGYTNRRLADEDFNDDTKDAGEMGAGHSVTALYEIVPVGVAFEDSTSTIDPLKYQKQKAEKTSNAANSGEILTVKIRYKAPTSDTSTKTEKVLTKNAHTLFEATSENMQWASAMSAFGMLLQNNELQNDLDYEDVLKIARKAMGSDKNSYRKEAIDMIQKAKALTKQAEKTAEQ